MSAGTPATPESPVARLRRWVPVLWPTVLTVALAWSIWPWLVTGSWPSLTGMALVAVLAASMTFSEIHRARMRRRRVAPGDLGPGAVQIREREIAYYGPRHGGFMSIDEIERIELLVWPDLIPGTMETDATWRLTGGGKRLEIPAHALGSEALHDAFAPLPGINWDAVARVLSAADAAEYTVWTSRR